MSFFLKTFSDFYYSRRILKNLHLFLLPLLYPISIIYSFLSLFHSFFRSLNSKKLLKSKSIMIGNINAGGVGKTPIAKFLANKIISSGKTCCIATKGFGRKVNENLLIKKNSKIKDFIGDEPMMFLEICDVFLIKKRTDILQIDGLYDYIIFDDGIHDLSIDYNYRIMIIDVNYKFGNCMFLPLGPIRINSLFLSCTIDCFLYMNEVEHKIKQFSEFDIEEKIHSISKNNNKKMLIFSLFGLFFSLFQPSFFIFRRLNRYLMLKNLFFNHKADIFSHKITYDTRNIKKNAKYIAISGIGINEKFFNSIEDISKDFNFEIVEKIGFSDHFFYTEKIINDILNKYSNKAIRLITTEKDFVKIKLLKNNDIIAKTDVLLIH